MDTHEMSGTVQNHGRPPPAAAPTNLATEPLLVVEGLGKTYRSNKIKWGRKNAATQTAALADINFTVAPGEIVTLLGPSGCGKTTLLRIIAGLATADSGRILLAGNPVVGPTKDKAFVFQHFGLLPWRDVIGNIEFPLELDGMQPAERRGIAQKYIDLVALAGFERHYPHSLSGGMQQRVGIARALTREPRLLLMDEPFGALDAQTREVLQDELLKVLQATRNTVIFVTHSISEAVLLSDRVVVFTPNPGRIKQIVEIPKGTVREMGKQARKSVARLELETQLRDLLRSEDGDA